MEEVIASTVARERPQYERFLSFLGTLGNNAPFIGLFGTVLGIIKAFHDLGATNVKGARHPADGDGRHLRGARGHRGGPGRGHPRGGRLQRLQPLAQDAHQRGTNALGHALVGHLRARRPQGRHRPGGAVSHGRRRSQDDDEEITGINVTPLVDIVLVLLIIFMVTANFIVRETVEVDLPRAANGGETVQGLVNVVIDKDGKLYFDGAEVTEARAVRAGRRGAGQGQGHPRHHQRGPGAALRPGDAPDRRGEGPGHRQVRAQHPEGRRPDCAGGRSRQRPEPRRR